MVRQYRIVAVVPAHNEAHQITTVLETMPPLVDRIIVVDDASVDATGARVRQCRAVDPRIQLVRCDRRRGVGGAIARGYVEALGGGYDVAVVLAGDGQMDPADLPAVLAPALDGQADYVKGSRFAYPGGKRMIPPLRRFGITVLSALTRLVAGYPQVSDSQCGYTAITREALAALNLDDLYPGYGYPNDLLGHLRSLDLRVAEVPVRPRYDIGEQSKMRVTRVVVPITFLLARVLIRRLRRRPVASGAAVATGRTPAVD